MKIIPFAPLDILEQAHVERLRVCKRLGQVAPIDKLRALAHYEAIDAGLRAEREAHRENSK